MTIFINVSDSELEVVELYMQSIDQLQHKTHETDLARHNSLEELYALR